MRVTFPHMGNLYIPLKAVFQTLGVDVVVPPPSSKRTLTLGSKYGPEFACLPLKLNLGNFIEAAGLGADTVVMAGGCGPCRFGYYAQIEKAILKDLGYDLQFIVFEPPESHIFELLARIRQIAGRNSWWRIIQAIRFGYQKALAVDETESSALFIRPREKIPGSTDEAYRRSLDLIDCAASPGELAAARKNAREIMDRVALEPGQPVLKVGFVGEIYTLLEPFANLDVERHLGRLGVWVDRSIYLSDWVNEHVFHGLARGTATGKRARSASSPYLRHFVGGHGQETIGEAVLYARDGYDGIIQVYPFTCMPEIIAQSILPDVSRDYDTHSLTFIMDENTGEAGMITRLEAFTDLLERKKEVREAL
ncbi:MAG: hypothetical protein BWY80_00741 [Firmicutes bacterium ADurb.Bin456]|nr:MAG: hypothetical protein BWY80_00741 [Firmicutes bacterium ADurb.Bin456]